jgi:hypothetical protein
MDRTRTPRTRTTRTTVALVATGATLASALAAGPATAARHAPCPTTGTTLARVTAPNLRVYRQGTALKACLRKPGTRRTVRTLGPWVAGTRVAAGGGAVAWTTPRPAPGGGTVDGLATEDVRTGRRWLKTVRAVPATSATTPAADDRVLGLLTDGRATAWVTARGVVAAALRALPEEPTTLYGEGLPGTEPFHVGRRFALGDAGPEAAPAVAAGLRLATGGDGDECGGTIDFQVRVPAFGGRPETIFRYASESYERTTGPCG